MTKTKLARSGLPAPLSLSRTRLYIHLSAFPSIRRDPFDCIVITASQFRRLTICMAWRIGWRLWFIARSGAPFAQWIARFHCPIWQLAVCEIL